ncbi:MAG: GNAT family N-acetyltransferase [Alphaproteobacteria bacterium]|nr:GNAT family N-acetyltransferase [Alphaproteobacteria bacterium]
MLVPNWTLMRCGLAGGIGDAAGEWQALAGRALVPSGFNRPEIIGPALKHVAGARLALVRDDQGLRLALPLCRRSYPLPIQCNWSSPVNFFGLPHLDADMAEPAMTALLRMIEVPLILHSVPLAGPFWDMLTASAGHFAVLDQWERAGLEITGTFEDWFEANFERKRRKEFRRLQARLAEQGTLAMKCLAPGADPAPWVEEFLRLESSGWKGRKGTAIAADPAAAEALRESSAALAASGLLRFWALELDGATIATLYAVVDGDRAWLGKITHDESLARYSPGALVVLYATERLFAEPGLAWVDSCAIPHHPMIDHIWRGRIPVADVIVAANAAGAMRFHATVMAERLRRGLRSAARNAILKITGRHRA